MTVPGASRKVAAVEILHERETPQGWAYRVSVEPAGGQANKPPREHEVTLSWVDHDHLCGGRFAPSRVVEVVVRYVYEHPTAREVPDSFDVATARRWFPGMDGEILGML